MIILHGDLTDPSFRCTTCGANYLMPQVCRRSHGARITAQGEAKAAGWTVPNHGSIYCPVHSPGATHGTTAA